MKVLVLSWEFPPRIVGGIARHVSDLYPKLVERGHTIHLVTVEFGEAPHYEVVEGIHIHRVAVPDTDDFMQWIRRMNAQMQQFGRKLFHEEGAFDLIHAHDWLVGEAAIALKHAFKTPLIATIHATEHGRYNGLHTPLQHQIHAQECHLSYEAWRIIVCTYYMREEIHRVLQVPADKIDVIYNGLRLEKWQHPPRFDQMVFRRQFAADHEKIIFYVGRMVYEKGIPILLRALPKVNQVLQGQVKCVLIGSGNLTALKQEAWDLGIWDKCYFTGFMSDADLTKFRKVADCAVFPSLYEPFGIVALESFAAEVPVVVSDTGGLPEVVQHGRTGIVTWPHNPDSLAWGILEVLQNPDFAAQLVDNAHNDLRTRFCWNLLAGQTEEVYARVIRERSHVTW